MKFNKVLQGVENDKYLFQSKQNKFASKDIKKVKKFSYFLNKMRGLK